VIETKTDSEERCPRQSPTAPIEASIAASIRWAVKVNEVYCGPVGVVHQARPGWPPVPPAPPQRHLAGIEQELGAVWVAAAQPMMALEYTSTMKAA
jgi:hypothetical protein